MFGCAWDFKPTGLIMAMFLRRRQKKSAGPQGDDADVSGVGKAELPDSVVTTAAHKTAELPVSNTAIAELSGPQKVQSRTKPGELPTQQTTNLRAELEGDAVQENPT